MPKGFGVMPDYGAKIADKAFDQSTRKIREVYRQAAVELQDKLKGFMERHRVKGTEMLRKLRDGEITQAEYHAWMRGQVFIGKQWDQKIKSAVKMLDTANQQCAGIIKTGRLNVFAENYNYNAYKLEKRIGGAVNFNIYNEDTVARLLKKNPKMLPEWKIHERKDYAWNRQKVENCITQGIVQGEGIDQITDRLVTTLCTQNENRMRLFARTSMTGAQNAGRLHQMEDAEEEGIKVKKRWVATLDNRTRDTHQDLDGQEVPVNEPFEVDGMEIMFPGDPACEHPELVYNCRCTMIEVYEGIDRKSVRRAYYDEDEQAEIDEARGDGKHHRDSYTVEDMTYNEWKEWKEGRKK
jgi:SPP1 gp7 family putative phage head morphogenesis protein